MASDVGGSIVDSLLYNLIATKQLYEFEIHQISTLIDLITKLHEEKKEEISSESKYFDTAYDVEKNSLINTVKKLQEKVKKLDKDIIEKQQAKNKLNSLFDMLGQLNEKERQMNSKQTETQDNELGIFEIREELDDDDNVISSSVNPYASGLNAKESKSQPTKKINTDKTGTTSNQDDRKEIKKSQDNAPKEKEPVSKIEEDKAENAARDTIHKPKTESEDFDPIMIREELDDDENVISGKLTKPVVPKQDDNLSNVDELNNEEDDVNEDQIAELLADMGLKEPEVPKLEEIKEEIEDKKTEKADIKEKETGSKSTSSMSAITLGGTIAEDDLLTLELIADELDEVSDENAPEFADDEEWDFVDDDEDEDEDDDDEDDEDDDDYEPDGVAFLKGLVPGRANDLFLNQLQSLRTGKPVESDSQSTLPIDEALPVLDKEYTTSSKKPKKSVSFASEVAVKEVENVWEEMNENSSKAVKVSAFKRRVSGNNTNEPQSDKPINELPKDGSSDEVLFDLTDKILDNSSNPVQFIAPKQPVTTSITSSHAYQPKTRTENVVDTPNKPLNLSNISKFKYKRQLNAAAPSLFKRKVEADAEPKPSESDGSKIENKEGTIFAKKSFSSLNPPRKSTPKKSVSQRSQGLPIETPKETNPEVPNPEFLAERESGMPVITNAEHDFEEVEDESFLESGEPSGRSNIQNSSVKDIETTKGDNTIEVVDTTLDYNSLQENMDTMAKAYILGLYDDDIHTQGEVIEELEDFERMNKIIESRQAKKTIFQEFGENTNSINMNPDEGLDAIPKEIDEDDENDKDESEDEEEDDGPVLASEIIEHIDDPQDDSQLDPEVSSISTSIPDPDLDVSLGSDVLNQNIALDYTRLRKKLMGQYNGGFKKSLKELELEPIDEFGNEVKVSRFKAAKLAMRNPKDII